MGVAQTKAGHFHVFIFKEDGMHDLGTLGGSFSGAHVVDSDLVVGVSEDRNRLRRGSLHDGRRMWDLNALVPNMKHWFITEATDINRNSEAVAMACNTNGVSQPTLLIPNNR